MSTETDILMKSDLLQFRRTSEYDLEFVLSTEQHMDNRDFIMSWSREQHVEGITCSDKLHLIIETPDKKAIGYIIFAGLANPNHCIELIRIAVAEKGRGYGKESIRLAQEYVFRNLNAHRLWLDVKENNYRARRLYEKAGFIVEGIVRECIKNRDSYESLILLGLLENEYRKLM